MSKSIKQYFLILMSAIFLISGSGVFVMIHTCFSGKKTEVSFSAEHKCCHAIKNREAGSTSFQKKCCSVVYQYVKLKVDNTERKQTTCLKLTIQAVNLIKIFSFDSEASINSFPKDCFPQKNQVDKVISFRQLLI